VQKPIESPQILSNSLHSPVWKTCGNRHPILENFSGGDISTAIHSTESDGTEEKWKTNIQISVNKVFSVLLILGGLLIKTCLYASLNAV